MVAVRDGDAREASAEEVSAAFMTPVEPLGVASVQHLHACGEVRLRRLHDQVIVRAHEAVRLAAPVVGSDRRPEKVEELDSVARLSIDERAGRALGRDVEDSVYDFGSRAAGHLESR
jgi:hypothetical protein